MNVKKVKITPEKAAQMLLRNFDRNRKLRRTTIKKYVADMQANRWQETAETIKFSTTGHLIDGQHRLTAIVESGCTLELYVATDVPTEAIMAIDTGAARSSADMLEINGECRYPKHVATLIRRIKAWEGGKGERFKGTLTPQQIISFSEKHPDLDDHVAISFKCAAKAVSPILHQGEWAFLSWLLSQRDREGAKVFLLDLAELTVPRDSPIRTLFNKLNETRVGFSSKDKYRMSMLAWNAWRNNETNFKLTVRTMERDIPELV